METWEEGMTEEGASLEGAQFVDEAIAQFLEADGNRSQVYKFWREHLTRFDEGFLAALPDAFQRLTEQQSPEFSAATFNDFGVDIIEFPLGVRWLNVEIAIAAYEQSLKVYTRESFPEQWAMTQNNLGAAYRNRLLGERGENLERAITAFEQALEVRTREAFPEKWAMTQNNLGIAYSNQLLGGRGENLERAIAAYEQALKVHTRESLPENWAMTQNNLGNAYLDRLLGERGENLERAIATYEQALEVYTRELFPEDWAMTQGNLAKAYRERDGDGDLDQAIELLQGSVAVASYKSQSFINDQYSLGNALSQRYDRDQNPNDLAAAETAYALALECVDPKHYDLEKYRNALPSVRAIMGGRLVRDGQWKRGLELLLTSLEELKTANSDRPYANALYQTARAYEYEDNQPKARTYYRDALRLYDRLEDILGLARCRYGLGNVLVNQGFPEKGKRELEAARAHYQTLGKQDKIEACDRLLENIRCVFERLNSPDAPPLP